MEKLLSSYFVFSESGSSAFFPSSWSCSSFGSHVISGLKSIWLRWKFSISLAWSNGALLTGGSNRKSFRPSGSHTLKGLAESRSERGRWRRRDGAKETREERRGGWQVRKYWWETVAGKKKSTKCKKDWRDVGLGWQEEEENCILVEGWKESWVKSEISLKKIEILWETK